MNARNDSLITATELKVLKLVCEGRKSQDVADALSVAKRTVDFHLRNAYQKLCVTNRMQAFHRAHELSLL